MCQAPNLKGGFFHDDLFVIENLSVVSNRPLPGCATLTRISTKLGHARWEELKFPRVQALLKTWMCFYLWGITYLVGKTRFKVLFHGPWAEYVIFVGDFGYGFYHCKSPFVRQRLICLELFPSIMAKQIQVIIGWYFPQVFFLACSCDFVILSHNKKTFGWLISEMNLPAEWLNLFFGLVWKPDKQTCCSRVNSPS